MATGSRLAAWSALASSALTAVGVVLLISMYTAFAVDARSTGLMFGAINDVLVLVGYLLALPVVVVLFALQRPLAPLQAILTLVIGVGAIMAIVVLQVLLVTGALTFEQQIGPAAMAFLVLGAWFVLVGFIGRSSGQLPNGIRMGLLAATYFGYPIWAFWISRQLRRPAGDLT